MNPRECEGCDRRAVCVVTVRDETSQCCTCRGFACSECEDERETNPRERGDDDGVEYADPRDEMARRMEEW